MKELRKRKGVPGGGGGGGLNWGAGALEGAGEQRKAVWLCPAPRSNFKVNCPVEFCIFWAEMSPLKL